MHLVLRFAIDRESRCASLGASLIAAVDGAAHVVVVEQSETQCTRSKPRHTAGCTRHAARDTKGQDTINKTRIAKTPNPRHKKLDTRYNKETEDPRMESRRRRRRYID